MKLAVQLATSAFALAALLGGAASHATNLADLPLKASVLAKPNVIFGMDDSSSMDFELMLYNNDGAFWWDYNNNSGWGVDAAHPNTSLRTITSTWFNNVGNSSGQWKKMTYLFPNGTGTGNRTNADANNDHFAILPTTEFAFTRWSGIYKDTGGVYRSAPSDPAQSPMHNPLYYNPLVTYQPWAPAQLSSGAVTPANATATAAKSHPMYGTGTMDLTANTTVAATGSPAGNTIFTAFAGMTIPAGARVSVCDANNSNCGVYTTTLLQATVLKVPIVGNLLAPVVRVGMPYYPATYWVRETCTVPLPLLRNVATDTCTYVPGSSTVTLKRYEIKAGNTFPSGRSYTAEMQNFANWWQYYRKRKLMLAGAMGETMENLSGMRLGVIGFNESQSGNVTMYDADSTNAASNRLRVAGIFYEVDRGGGTPTRPTLKYIGDQFKRTDKSGSSYNMIQYACQRNNAFIVTDGFANNDSTSPPSWDSGKSAATWGTGAPYAQDYSHNGTLSDLALRYYTNNPRGTGGDALAVGKLQATPRDGNTDLHMNTYGLTLGARGTLFLSETSPVPTTTAAWPDPDTNRNPTSVDDLWHATINGRGKMYLATTPEETALRIRAGLDDILSQEGAQGGIAVSSVNLAYGDAQAYLGSYNPRGWTGDLTANAINIDTGAITTTASVWSAATKLTARTWSDRVIFTAKSGAGVDFNATEIGATANPDSATFTNAVTVDYLRGSRVGEGDTVRLRSSLMGPVVNAEPVLARDETMVYVASGEGMLHAIDTVTGVEHWAFVPPDQIVGMGKSIQRGWVYQTLFDATPSFGKLSSGTKMLVGGLGSAGRSYYALDVSSPRSLAVAQAKEQFKWIFPAAGDATLRAKVGYTVGKPLIVKAAAGDVVLVTSGYDKGTTVGDGKGRMWMLNATTGAVLKTFRTTVGSTSNESGLAQISAFKASDGLVRYVYGGDLLGNLWRFDLTATGGSEIDGTLVATLKDASNNPQPITAAPELTTVSGKRVVLVGTGRLLDLGDFGSSRTQSFYAIADSDSGPTLTDPRAGLVARVYTRSNDTFTGAAFNWASDRGWYFDLPTGEQANTEPVIAYGAVAFTTNINGSSDCSQMSYLYLVDVGTGKKVEASTMYPSPFGSMLLSGNATSSRPVILRTRTGRVRALAHLSNNGSQNPELPLGAAIKAGKNAWREIRR